jgi:hypothetical protein
MKLQEMKDVSSACVTTLIIKNLIYYTFIISLLSPINCMFNITHYVFSVQEISHVSVSQIIVSAI